LQIAKEKLQQKEDMLRVLEAELIEERSQLDKLSAKLLEREKKVNELNQILKEKEDAVTKLKNKISQALRGFEGSGLTIVEKNGKVYVSMDEKLLFASGSTTVDSRGRQAIVEIAKALEKEADINVMIEGHTDNVPLSGSGAIKDNWDLSVLRATSIAKIMLENKNIDPSRIIVAGRGEHQPIAPNDTRENKAKNRRTEIILTPKLNELFQILEN
jgi:chemotaxis protein MotB